LVKKCPECGADNRDDAIYCSSCGVQISVPPPVPTVLPVARPAPPPRAPPPSVAPPFPFMMPLPPPPRPLWGTLITIAAGILIMVGIIAAYVYPPSQQLVLYLLQILLPTTPVASLMAVATVVGVVLTFTMFLAAFLMFQGYGTFGGIIGFIAAVVSITIGGGFLAGFTLGIIGAFLAVMRK
jgi:hypothetical protein